jgi:hypothetical protein
MMAIITDTTTIITTAEAGEKRRIKANLGSPCFI